MANKTAIYWHYGREYCGIEHGSSPTGDSKISCLTAIKRSGEFEINKKFKIDTPSDLPGKLKKNQHCFLVINTNQVLLKSTTGNGPDTKIVTSAFPNIDLNNFYYKIQRSAGTNWVGLCRKEHVHEIIRVYESYNISVVGFSLGFLSLSNLFPLLENETLYTSGYQFTIANKEVVKIERTAEETAEEEIMVGDTTINSRYLIALSGILNYHVNYCAGSNFKIKNSELTQNHRQKVFFRKGAIIGVSFLLVALVLNFFFFSSYYSSLQTMLARHQVELAQQEVLQENSRVLAEKEKIVRNIHDNSTSNTTFFLNRTITTKPSSILLSEFNFQPLKKQVKKNEPIDFEKGLIVLKGESREETEFSTWIRRLEGTVWIEEVTVSEYGHKGRTNAQFIISIKIKPNETVQ